MPLEKHPLSTNLNWRFFQPLTEVNTKYVTFEKDGCENPVGKVNNISQKATCREILVYEIRQTLKRLTVTEKKVGPNPWNIELTQSKEIHLTDPRIFGPKATTLCMDVRYLRKEDLPYHADPPANHEQKINLEEFIKVADIVVGLPAVLLNPNRLPGNWWKTDPKDCVIHNFIHWNGADATILRHPALLAVISGLYRQAFLLCYAGFGPKILETGCYEDVVKAISAAEWKPVFGMAEAFREWINVPPPGNSNTSHFSFPWIEPRPHRVSYWQRFVRLQRALRRHGYDRILGEDIYTSWDLLGKNQQYTGAYSFWGGRGSTLTEAHKRVMELGAPLKRGKG